MATKPLNNPPAVKRARKPRTAKVSAEFGAGIAPGQDTTRRASSTTDQVVASWNPRLTAPDQDWRWERTPAVARTRDLVDNEGLAAAAVDRPVGMIVGGNLRYSAKPIIMAKRLGIDLEVATQLSHEIVTAWENWSLDPMNRADWQQTLNFGGMVNLLTRHWVRDGEGLAVLRWTDKPKNGWKWRTSLHVIDPDRLSNPLGRLDNLTLHNGIETDGQMATAYHIREAHPSDRYAYGLQVRWERVPVTTPEGRPVIIHLRRKKRADEYRGVSPLVAVLRKFKSLQRYTDSEIQAAAVNAQFVGSITTTMSKTESAEALGVEQLTQENSYRDAFYSGSDPRLSDGSRFVRLFPGDDLKLLTTPRYAASYQMFQTSVLQAIASGLGMSYEQLSMDYSKTNYSSARAAMVESWRTVLDNRALVATQVCNPVLLAVIEEGIDNGDINPPADIPELYENPAGWLSGQWIGPGRGWVDPVKEAQASALRIAAGLSTLEAETDESTGGDWEANLGQLKIEAQAYQDAGFTPPSLANLLGKPAAVAVAADAAETEQEDPSPAESKDGGDHAAAPPAHESRP